MSHFKYLALVGAFLTANVIAAVPESGSTGEGELTESIQPLPGPAPAGRFTGMIDMRPSYVTDGGEFHMENVFDLGYRFNPNFYLGVRQQLNTNMHNWKEPNLGLNPQPMQGIIRATFSNLANVDGWSLAYEPRLYVPENQTDFDTKRYLSIRNYVMLSKQVTSFYTLTFMEIPVFQFYGARGYTSPSGKVRPNSYYENRFYIMNDFTFGRFSIEFPIAFVSTSNLDYAGKQGQWMHSLWFWPLVAYNVNANVQVGMAVYTESIVAPDLSGFTVADKGAGLYNSTAQILFRANL